MSENRQIRRRFGQPRVRTMRARALRPVALRHAMAMAFALLALAIQSFVIQTHIHIPQAHGRVQSVSLATLAAAAVSDKTITATASPDTQTASAPRDKYPISEDPTNCPLCQEIAHSGQFVQSAVFIAALPFLTHVHAVVFDEALPSLLTASHIWQGRAPPKA